MEVGWLVGQRSGEKEAAGWTARVSDGELHRAGRLLAELPDCAHRRGKIERDREKQVGWESY